MEYKHKKSGIKVTYIESNGLSHQYIGDRVNLPKWVVEDSQEWELIDDDKKYTIGDIRNTFERLNQYSCGTTFIQDFIKSLKNG